MVFKNPGSGYATAALHKYILQACIREGVMLSGLHNADYL